MSNLVPEERIESKIFLIRGQKVMLDFDLAKLYQVPTGRLSEQVKRNIDRFPKDFMFQLSKEEAKNLISQFATSRWGGRRKLLEQKVEGHDKDIKSIFDVIRQLIEPNKKTKAIGFVVDE